MSGVLQELLQAKEPLFSLAVRQLELASGREGRDVRLIAEIAGKMRANTAALGLDPNDTTGRELYGALLARIDADNKRIAKIVGSDNPDDVAAIMPLLVKTVQMLDIAKDCWVIKRSVAKKLLKTMPPKKLMKHLGHRSVESMLKHENIDEVYTALRFSEGDRWLNDFNDLFATIQPSDFETRELSIVIMDEKYADLTEAFVQKKRHNITHAKEMGTIVIVPMKATRVKGIALTSLSLLLHYVNEVRLYSAFFKLKQVQPDFGKVVVDTLLADPSDAAEMAGQYVHWRVIQRYFGKLKDVELHPEVFEPHVQPEDLHWRKAEEMMTMIDPGFQFWVDQDYVGKLYDGKPLSFNFIDMSLSYSNEEPYESCYYFHFREALWNELFARYMGVTNLREQVLNQLDNSTIAPENLRA